MRAEGNEQKRSELKRIDQAHTELPVRHGGDVYRNRVRLDFSVSINPMGPPEGALKAYRDSELKLQRSELASRFNCVPSQINYVISTRFSPERGYIVESRRGGGGYIRITRVRVDPQRLVMHTVNSVGEAIDPATCAALTKNLLDSGTIDPRSSRLILAATGNNALRPVAQQYRDVVRASIFKQMLLSAI